MRLATMAIGLARVIAVAAAFQHNQGASSTIQDTMLFSRSFAAGAYRTR